VDHLRKAGFTVEENNVHDLGPIRKKHRVPAELSSCHTALVAGYVIEGHVPADLIDRLLQEKPKVVGLAVPGMPLGSPGMDAPPGRKVDRYQVLAFDAQGKTTVYATR
jgi:hypothetical protein